MTIHNSIQKWLIHIQDYRRALHQIPETAFEEVQTATFIEQTLKEFGYTPTRVLPTGIKAVLPVPHAKSTIALRADIDALPIEEKTGLPFCSIKKGTMHACGHDGHTALLLALAGYLMEHKDLLQHNVVFIFQPAEEGFGGALEMKKAGVLQNPPVDFIYSFHVSPLYEQGALCVSKGVATAGDFAFDINIQGKSSHAAIPQDGIDTVVIAAQLVNLLQTVVSRTNNPLCPLIFTIGTLQAGNKRNIIADHALLECTIRSFDDTITKAALHQIQKICDGLGAATGARIEIELKHSFMPVYNHPQAVDQLLSLFDEDELKIVPPLVVAEDFFTYVQDCAGAMFLVGIKNSKKGHIHPLHSEYFNFDEHALLSAMELYRRLLLQGESFKAHDKEERL